MSNLSEEEQEAIEYFKNNALVRIENEQIIASGNAYKVVILNYISKLQKENEELKNENKEMTENYVKYCKKIYEDLLKEN